MVGLIAVWASDYLQGEEALATIPVHDVTVSSLAERIREARGQVLILMLYRPDSDDPYTVGDLRRWAVQTSTPKVGMLAVAVGTRRDARLLSRDGVERGVQRLPPERLAPEQAVLLDSLMVTLGVLKKGDRSKLPLTVVFDRNGRATGQWHGILDYQPVLVAAKAARRQ